MTRAFALACGGAMAAVCLAASSALAANCPKTMSPTAIAEAGLHLHTQVMVRALFCQKNGKAEGESDFPSGSPMRAYADFTQQHRGLLSDWERVLIAKKGLGKFDTWRTETANKISRSEGAVTTSMDSDVYCATARRQAETLMAMSTDDLTASATGTYCGTSEPSRAAPIASSKAAGSDKPAKKTDRAS